MARNEQQQVFVQIQFPDEPGLDEKGKLKVVEDLITDTGVSRFRIGYRFGGSNTDGQAVQNLIETPWAEGADHESADDGLERFRNRYPKVTVTFSSDSKIQEFLRS